MPFKKMYLASFNVIDVGWKYAESYTETFPKRCRALSRNKSLHHLDQNLKNDALFCARMWYNSSWYNKA